MLYSQSEGTTISFVHRNTHFFIQNFVMVIIEREREREREKERERDGGTATMDTTWRETYSELCFFYERFYTEAVLS